MNPLPPEHDGGSSHPSPKRASVLSAIAQEVKGSVQRRDNQPVESAPALRRARWTALVKWFKSKNGSGTMVKTLFASLDADGSGDVDIMEVRPSGGLVVLASTSAWWRGERSEDTAPLPAHIHSRRPSRPLAAAALISVPPSRSLSRG